MGVTRLFLTATKSAADQTAGFWNNHPDGYTVHAFGPTAAMKVQDAQAANTLWQTSPGGPWYGVLVTKPDAAAGAAASAALAKFSESGGTSSDEDSSRGQMDD